ncbi:MAG: hypothetical protein ACREI2_06095 [Nitrospiraceae bacterium]
MPFEYYAENHDWDLTVRASWNLLMSAQAVKRAKDFKQKNEQEFSFLTGAMLLSFCAVESYITSVAFSMSRDERYKGFNYRQYKRQNKVWDKIQMVCNALRIRADQSSEPFKTIEAMRKWRNSLVHASPYSIETVQIVQTKDSRELHDRLKDQPYTATVRIEEAKSFYDATIQLIDLVKKASGLDPRAMCSYKVL